LDYSKGFPDWWFLSHTEITVPSEHTQEGKYYDAEVHLAHFYSVDHQRKVGKVALFLEADPNRERWDFLDKLICQWREVEEQTRDECGLESVPAYPGCRNPTRDNTETDLPGVDPYPFIDCDSVENSERICKPSSCCEAERSTGSYCEDDVYGKYGDETVGSVCWWCCPGKLLGPAEEEPTVAPFMVPSPSQGPVTFAPFSVDTSGPTKDPDNTSAMPTAYDMTSEPTTGILPAPTLTATPMSVSAVVCSDYNGHPEIRLKQICEDGGCCDPKRSSTDHCHATYKFFGESMASVCSDCCSPSKSLAPAPPPHPIYTPIDCTLVKNPFRICKPTSCCNDVRSTTNYCEETYEEYGEIMGSICWHCCSEPKEVDPSVLPPSPPLTPIPTYALMPSSAPNIINSIPPSTMLTTGAPSAITDVTSTLYPSSGDTPSPTRHSGKTFGPTSSPSATYPSGAPSENVMPSQPSSTRPVATSVCPDTPVGGCSVCSPDNCVGNPDAIFAFPGQPEVPCGILQDAGYRGNIPLDQCTLLPLLLEICECAPSDAASASPTAVASTQPSITPSVGTVAPVATSVCPKTPIGGCSVCGPDSCIGNPDAIFAFPGQPEFPCGILQDAGYGGSIPLEQCALLPFVLEICECVPAGVATVPPTIAPVATTLAANSPSQVPSASAVVLSESPSASPSNGDSMVVGLICETYKGFPEANFGRICSNEAAGCCNEKRGDARFCHKAYNLFGDDMDDVCSQCCTPAKEVAPPPPPHPVYEPTNCALLDNPGRICRSCCDATMSTTDYCEETYLNFTETIGSICWYCCSDPVEVDPAVFELTASPSSTPTASSVPSSEQSSIPSDTARRGLLRQGADQTKAALDSISDGLTEAEDVLLTNGLWARDLVMDPANFEVSDNLEEEYVASIEAYQKRREEAKRLAQKDQRRRLSEGIPSGDNYVNVPYSPYEWMREVKTEYYYRYEGTQMVPPCFETVHWRVMKDPIRIHPDQLVELERLLAWRIAPKGSEFNECDRDTAGRERPESNGNAVDLNRPLQSYSNIHRKVFCECNDWDSKWKEDRDWCELDADTRFYEQPYNYATSGF
jgi:hypothetical protein